MSNDNLGVTVTKIIEPKLLGVFKAHNVYLCTGTWTIRINNLSNVLFLLITIIIIVNGNTLGLFLDPHADPVKGTVS